YFHVLFGDMHLYGAIGDKSDVARIALVLDAGAAHPRHRLHVEDVTIECVHGRDVGRGEVDVMQFELHSIPVAAVFLVEHAQIGRPVGGAAASVVVLVLLGGLGTDLGRNLD